MTGCKIRAAGRMYFTSNAAWQKNVCFPGQRVPGRGEVTHRGTAATCLSMNFNLTLRNGSSWRTLVVMWRTPERNSNKSLL